MSYYRTLGVEKNATNEEIKKAYRNRSLLLHPDRNRENPQAEQMFQELNAAYSVLSNPKKREIFDRYGERGVFLFDQGVLGEDAEILQLIPVLNNSCLILMIGWALWALITMIPIFLVLKIGGTVDWKWHYVFIPFWIFDAILVLSTLALMYASTDRLRKAISWFTLLACFISFQILLVVNLHLSEHNSSFLWSFVFIPVYIFILQSLIESILEASYTSYSVALDHQINPNIHKQNSSSPQQHQNNYGTNQNNENSPLNNQNNSSHNSQNENQQHHTEEQDVLLPSEFGFLERALGYFGFILRHLVSPLIQIWFLVFLIVQLDLGAFESWWTVSIPLFVLFVWRFFVNFSDQQNKIQFEGAGGIATRFASLISLMCVFALPFSFVVMLFYYLGTSTSTLTIAEIFIPVFIVCGFILCCCACCFPCLLFSTKQNLQQMVEEGQPTQRDFEKTNAEIEKTIQQQQKKVLLEEEKRQNVKLNNNNNGNNNDDVD